MRVSAGKRDEERQDPDRGPFDPGLRSAVLGSYRRFSRKLRTTMELISGGSSRGRYISSLSIRARVCAIASSKEATWLKCAIA